MRLIPSPTTFPLNLYKANQIIPTTIASAIRKSLEIPYSYASTIDNFPRDLIPSKGLPHKFKPYFNPQPITPPTKYIIHHVDDSDNKDESFFGMFNPFECESEDSEEDDDNDEDDENEILETPSSNEFYERKFLKLLKWKKKKKKKKKIILFKLFIGILVFLAVKFLLKKAFKFVPAVLAFVRRDELYHDGEHELDRDVDFAKTSTTDENFVIQHRELFPSSYGVEYKLIL
ncbi:hypothetical protein ACKWTF_012459 [Chironomus riparius]